MFEWGNETNPGAALYMGEEGLTAGVRYNPNPNPNPNLNVTRVLYNNGEP